MRDAVLALPVSGPESERALELLRGWDGQVTAGSSAAAVYELFLAEMYGRTARAKAPRSWEWALGKGYTAIAPHNLFHHRRAGHLMNLVPQQPPGCFERPWAEELADALDVAVRKLTAKHGADPAGWQWGQVRPLTLLPPVGGRQPLDRGFQPGR